MVVGFVMGVRGSSGKCRRVEVVMSRGGGVNVGLNRVRNAVGAAVVAGVLLGAPGGGYADVLSFDHDQSLVGAEFSNRKDLVGAIFTKANCQAAVMVKADLTNANVEDANFSDADLTSARLDNVFAPKAKFNRAKLIDTTLIGANLIGAKFDGAVITGADFSDAIIDPATVIRLCKKASGTNPVTQVPTTESLNCPE